MGKRKKLNRLITKWIKSDLPEDHSTVLLLGVTKIPTSPNPTRRPCSLSIVNPFNQSHSPVKSKFGSITSSSSTSTYDSLLTEPEKCKLLAAVHEDFEKNTNFTKNDAYKQISVKPKSGNQSLELNQDCETENLIFEPIKEAKNANTLSNRESDSNYNTYGCRNNGLRNLNPRKSAKLKRTKSFETKNKNSKIFGKTQLSFECNKSFNNTTCKVSFTKPSESKISNGQIESDHSNKLGRINDNTILTNTPEINLSATESEAKTCLTQVNEKEIVKNGRFEVRLVQTTEPKLNLEIMDRSVDSIGTCSLDVDISADNSELSEGSSVGTLRSFKLTPSTPINISPVPEQRLPSYLSLACTVSGYSTTTNYDPERLARSRDPSPHRLPNDNEPHLTFSIHNNLLSPPNLVPLPLKTLKMDSQNKENLQGATNHSSYYSSSVTTKKMTYSTVETKSFSKTIISSDSVDACLENVFRNGKHVSISSSNKMTITNGQIKEFTSNSDENKSFIQQRVERLYGPGALAQGFFVQKRQSNRLSDMDVEKNSSFNNSKNSSINDTIQNGNASPNMKQSNSSPALPVLRHLRPEFRAQLPILSPKKSAETSSMQKSFTTPVLNEQSPIPTNKVQINGKVNGSSNGILDNVVSQNGQLKSNVEPMVEIRDGHYFLNILSKETKRLLDMANEVEKELEDENLSEDAKGYIRSAAGKAKLLVSQKMQQFKGLCTNNLNQVQGEAFPTTNEDLQGFWDMVMLQVNQVDVLFAELKELKDNNWQEKKSTEKVPARQTNKALKTGPPKPRPSGGNDELRKLREAQRKAMIEQKRKAMKEAKVQEDGCIEMFVPETS